MPAPENLNAKTPGEPLGTITPLTGDTTTSSNEQDTDQAQPPMYVAKHIAGGRWHVVTNDAEAKRVGDFVGDKAAVQVELARLLDGGEPLVLDPQRENDRATLAAVKPTSTDVDPTTLKQAVMTPDGWLCPEPPVKE